MTSPDPVGRLFGGRYRLEGLLGVGGSASVYQAEDALAPGGPARVAVKVLHPHLCSDERVREAFLREARQAEGLSHPNIVAVRASGLHEAGGMTMAWIALDLVIGPTLGEWVKASGRLAPADAAAVLHGVLAGLGVAHDAGVVHRDVSPRNVILEGLGGRPPGSRLAAGMVRLLDFGLADAAGRTTVGRNVLLADDPPPIEAVETRESQPARGLDKLDRQEGGRSPIEPVEIKEPSVTSGLGGSGGQESPPLTVVGSVHYMSPEQAQGLPVGPAGDLYQAGAVLYFLLTGQPPYPRATAEQVLDAHLSAPPPVPSALVPAARPLDRVVTTAMAKDPERRYRSVTAFRMALAEALANGLTQSTRADTPTPTRVIPVGPQRLVSPGRPVGPAPSSGPLSPSPHAGGPAGSSGRPTPPPGRASYPASSGQFSSPPPQASGSSGGLLAGIAAVAVVAVAVWAVASASQGSGQPAPSGTPGPEPSFSPTPPPVFTPSPTPSATRTRPAEVTVPILRGSLSEAVTALRDAGLVLGEVSREQSAEQADRVLDQSPRAGRTVQEGGAVDVVVASGENAVPEVAGMTAAAAKAIVESAGFVVELDDPAAATAIVSGAAPPSGTVLRVGVTVTLLLAGPTPSPTPTASVSSPSTPAASTSPPPTPPPTTF